MTPEWIETSDDFWEYHLSKNKAEEPVWMNVTKIGVQYFWQVVSKHKVVRSGFLPDVKINDDDPLSFAKKTAANQAISYLVECSMKIIEGNPLIREGQGI